MNVIVVSPLISVFLFSHLQKPSMNLERTELALFFENDVYVRLLFFKVDGYSSTSKSPTRLRTGKQPLFTGINKPHVLDPAEAQVPFSIIYAHHQKVVHADLEV